MQLQFNIVGEPEMIKFVMFGDNHFLYSAGLIYQTIKNISYPQMLPLSGQSIGPLWRGGVSAQPLNSEASLPCVRSMSDTCGAGFDPLSSGSMEFPDPSGLKDFFENKGNIFESDDAGSW